MIYLMFNLAQSSLACGGALFIAAPIEYPDKKIGLAMVIASFAIAIFS